MGQERMSVVQIGDPKAAFSKSKLPQGSLYAHDEPVGDCKPWNAIIFDHCGTPILPATQIYEQNHCQYAIIRHYYSLTLCFVKNNRIGVEVVGKAGVSLLPCV